ncbi:hypothetical protein [Sphingosinicella sp. CPCC 101087]|uniref:hypothetical protein n=1 Tax=Sphingosinicella sp. CPCC 101087 TaxID=2497754 RepID=UPI00101C1712|nr:hypothetical protein [Sphingosinicella sp. CPCC 101087]
MSDSRITVSVDELSKSIAIWLTVVGQRRPGLLRDLWTRTGEARDQVKREHARHELARYLAEKLAMSGHEVTRQATGNDALMQE